MLLLLFFHHLSVQEHWYSLLQQNHLECSQVLYIFLPTSPRGFCLDPFPLFFTLFIVERLPGSSFTENVLFFDWQFFFFFFYFIPFRSKLFKVMRLLLVDKYKFPGFIVRLTGNLIQGITNLRKRQSQNGLILHCISQMHEISVMSKHRESDQRHCLHCECFRLQT